MQNLVECAQTDPVIRTDLSVVLDIALENSRGGTMIQEKKEKVLLRWFLSAVTE